MQIAIIIIRHDDGVLFVIFMSRSIHIIQPAVSYFVMLCHSVMSLSCLCNVMSCHYHAFDDDYLTSCFQACRDVTRGSEAAERIRNLTGNHNVECRKLNLVKIYYFLKYIFLVLSFLIERKVQILIN